MNNTFEVRVLDESELSVVAGGAAGGEVYDTQTSSTHSVCHKDGVNDDDN